MRNPENRGEPIKKNNTCPLCLQTSNHQFICKAFENNYHIKHLPKNDDEVRAILAKSLPVLYGSFIFNRKIDDTRQIFKDFPTVKISIVIHKRYYINHDITLVRHTDNICIECTLVRAGCIEHDLYRRVFFSPEAVMKYIWKSKSNIIGSQLHHILPHQYEDIQN